MLTGQYVWGTVYSTPDEIFELIRANDIVFPRFLSHDARDLIQRLLERDPHKRLASAARIREHAFFKAIDWSKLRCQVGITAIAFWGLSVATSAPSSGLLISVGATSASLRWRPPKFRPLHAT